MVVDLSKYSLDKLRTGEEFVLYRGRGEGALSPILIVTPASEHPAAKSLQRLEYEFNLRGELDPAWAAQPIACIRDEGRTKLVLRDPGGEPLDRFLGAPMDLNWFLRLAVKLAVALGQVHRRGLVHRDLKPANILLDRAADTIWLTGFGIAGRSAPEGQPREIPEVIAGTLAYMAPEQTGRMNRETDSRSDLYSLGVTLYEMLTGALPFTATEPMEWVHCHIAKQPMPPGERVRGIPTAISAIVMKLLAKTAEGRYQTAHGAEADLRRCLRSQVANAEINPFALGSEDPPSRLTMPAKLYGRDDAREVLLGSFRRAATRGSPELVLVSGYSGIGKSSVVYALEKEMGPARGLFAACKFDQYKRNIPYATLAQAFKSLTHQILAKSDAEVAHWREALHEVLGPNAQLIVNLIPEIEYIIGDQPAVPELPPKDAKNRFQMVLRRFLAAFARPEHPLVLFLDDLQWLDVATLELLEYLLSAPEMDHLLLIGAYRTNEVTPAHPLMRTLTAIRNKAVRVHEVELAPLELHDLEALLADALHCERSRSGALAQLVHGQTGGNPFFTIQFLKALAEERMLIFDPAEAAWTWDLERIRAKGYTDNVAEFMAGKLNRLSLATQEILKRFACLGSGIEVVTASLVLGRTAEAIDSEVEEAVRAGLISRRDQAYVFLHDRVREVAYALIPESEKPGLHLHTGRRLAELTPPGQLEEKIFEIVNQLNRATLLVNSAKERQRIAEFNLIAGKRAKAAAAYASALTYLSAGRELLTEDAWNRQYSLTFALELHLAECEFLTGNIEAAKDRLGSLAGRAKGLIDRGAVTYLQVALYTALDLNEEAVKAGLEYFKLMGVHWSLQTAEDEVKAEYQQIWRNLGNRPIESLIDLPAMTDPVQRVFVDVLAIVEEPAFFANEHLRCLIVARMVNLSLEYGNTDGSCIAYLHLGWLLGPRFGDYESAFRFGKLSLDLMEKCGLERFRARVFQCFSYFVNPWGAHLGDGIPLLRRSFYLAQQSGDPNYTAYSCDRLVTMLLAAGEKLEDVQREAENGIECARKLGSDSIVAILNGQLRLVLFLRGRMRSVFSFDDAEFNEERFVEQLGADRHLAFVRCWFWIRKLQALFHAGEYTSAVEAGTKVEMLMQAAPSFFEAFEYHFYDALARAACYNSATDQEKAAHLTALTAHQHRLQGWAVNGSENFADRAALIAAEIGRIEGRDLEAMHCYEKAINAARENGFIQNESIAHELAAHFYQDRGLERLARVSLREARHCYFCWGALGKVRLLDQRYPYLGDERPSISAATTIDASLEHLDLEAVLRASQAVSSEIVLDTLIESLMKIVVEHAGAERGHLILLRNHEARVEAEAEIREGRVRINVRNSAVCLSDLPEAILNYVIRTRTSLILDNASGEHLFSADPYIQRAHAKSVLCLPLLKQAKLIGLLYLENNLATGVFTPSRRSMLELLASQIAISLENARLYADLGRLNADLATENRDRRQAEEALRDSEQRLQDIIDNTSAIVSVKDLELRYLLVNREYERRYRVRRDQVRGKTDFDIFPPEVAKAIRLNDRRVIETGEPIEFEEVLPSDGREYFHVAAKFLLRDQESTPYAVCGISTDVTERKRAEEALRRAQAALSHITRVMTIGELTASIAHEVNQPLTGIVTNASACLRWLDGSPPNLYEARESLTRILRDGRRAADVISRIRALVRKAKSEMAPLNINEALQEVVQLIQFELRKNKVKFDVNLDPGLPPVIADRVQFQQVVLNLLINAIEAMAPLEDTGRELRLISRWHEPATVLIAVRDSGIGIGSLPSDELFEAFFTTKSQGMGMGLAISRSIVEAHDGRLWAESNSDRGATFQFILPVKGNASDDRHQ